jgi:transportin-1
MPGKGGGGILAEPHFCIRRSTGNAHGETDSESDGEEVNRWNLRKCSAAGLDVLSTVFGEELLPIVTPIVQQRLQVQTRTPL